MLPDLKRLGPRLGRHLPALRSLLAEKRGVYAPAEAAPAVTASPTLAAAKTQVREVKPGKSGAGLFKPVTAKAGQPYAVSATVLLMAMNQGMLSGSGVARVLVVNEPVLQQQ